MPSILAQLPQVGFLASKNFTLLGKKYEVGDEVPEAKGFINLEVLVRTRFLMPVVDNYDELPFQFRRMAFPRDIAYKKLNRTPPKGLTESPYSNVPAPERENVAVEAPYEQGINERDAATIEPEAIPEEVIEEPDVSDTSKVIDGREETEPEVFVNREPSDEVYDPLGPISEVYEYAQAHPALIEDVIEREEAGKNRSTLLTKLYKLLEEREEKAETNE